jgi:hypothetical protein
MSLVAVALGVIGLGAGGAGAATGLRWGLRAGDGVTGVPALAAAACDRAEAGSTFAAGGADGAMTA